MTTYSHDEIVIAIDEALTDIVKKVTEELLQDSSIQRTLPFYNKILLLEKFLQSDQRELVRRINKSPVSGTKKRPDIECFGGLIVIEVETSEDTLETGRKQLMDYINEFYKDIALYGIVTTGFYWEIYMNEEGKLKNITALKVDPNVSRKPLQAVIRGQPIYDNLYSIIKGVLLKPEAYRLQPSPDNIRRIFLPVMSYTDDLLELMNKFKIHEKALYKSYSEILRRVYGKLTAEEMDKLFVIHTLLQMITNVIIVATFGKLEKHIVKPIRACLSEEIEYDISIPHLMWWREIAKIDKDFERKVAEICSDVYYRALMFDWNSDIVEDVFSHLYEDFIERSLRYKIGEYYTPWWLIELIIYQLKTQLNVSFKDKLILDPACGSGRFLVRAFYEKVKEEGEDPDKAYLEVVGLDILPLAATIARSELMIAYRRTTGKIPPGTPLVFWGDYLSSEIELGAEVVRELSEILERLTKSLWEDSDFINLNINKYDLLLFLSRLEIRIERMLKDLIVSDKVASEAISNLTHEETAGFTDNGQIENLIEKLLDKIRQDDVILKDIKTLIENFGNSIWAIPLVSDLFVRFMPKLKPDIVLTNPPWLKLSELPNSKWGEKVHKYVKDKIVNEYKKKKIIKKSKVKKPQYMHYIIPGLSKAGMSGDISALFLNKIIKDLDKEGYIGIVMPAEQSYTPRSPHGAGKLLTYAILSRYNVKGHAIYVGDAFKHGRHASIFIIQVRKNE